MNARTITKELKKQIPPTSSNGLPIKQFPGIIKTKTIKGGYLITAHEPITLTGNYDRFTYNLQIHKQTTVTDLTTQQRFHGSLKQCLQTIIKWSY